VPTTGGPNNLVLSATTFFADGSAKLSLSDGSGGWNQSWDGTASDGSFAAAGVYRVVATYVPIAGGASQTKQAVVAVVPVSGDLADHLIVAPNPATGRQPAQLRWLPTTRASLVQGRVYNMAGELIFVKTVDASGGSLSWDLRSPSGELVGDGIYLWQVNVMDDHGRVIERVIKKLAVLRH
jgi:hypothetical protein